MQVQNSDTKSSTSISFSLKVGVRIPPIQLRYVHQVKQVEQQVLEILWVYVIEVKHQVIQCLLIDAAWVHVLDRQLRVVRVGYFCDAA
jgi:hypothetical protein